MRLSTIVKYPASIRPQNGVAVLKDYFAADASKQSAEEHTKTSSSQTENLKSKVSPCFVNKRFSSTNKTLEPALGFETDEILSFALRGPICDISVLAPVSKNTYKIIPWFDRLWRNKTLLSSTNQNWYRIRSSFYSTESFSYTIQDKYANTFLRRRRHFNIGPSKCQFSTAEGPPTNTPSKKDERNIFPASGRGDEHSISSYKPINLAYISYEKKSSEKDMDSENTSSKRPTQTPLIMQHGMFGTKENWKTVSKEINFITKRAVYSVDGRNHGESPHSNEMTFALMAKDIRNFCNQLGYQKISFLGHHGLGGRIGMMIAMLYPEMLDKLIIVDSTPLMSVKSQQRYAQLREASTILKKIELELRQSHGYQRSLVAEQAIEHVIKDKRDIAVMLSNLINEPLSPAKLSKSGNETSDETDSHRLWKCNLDAFLNNTGITNFPTFDETNAFHGKTLFVQSAISNYISEDDVPHIRRIFPSAEFAWIKCKSGSAWFHVENHTEFMQSIVGFLEDGTIKNQNISKESPEKGDAAETRKRN